MQLGARTVSTPQGVGWRVHRVWIERRIPRWRKVDFQGTASDAAWLTTPETPEELLLWPAVILGTIVVAVVLIPLLLFGIELILLGTLIALTIVGRGLLGRPWLVRAEPVDGGGAAIAWRVVGWRRSRRVITEATEALAIGSVPRPAEPVEEFAGGAARGVSAGS